MALEMSEPEYTLSERHLQELVHWARRYVDGRSTYAPSSFNEVLHNIMERYPDFVPLLDDQHYFPWAQDGMYNPDNGNFDARPRKVQLELREGYKQRQGTSKPL